MFATPDLAARIDRAEGRLCSDLARAVMQEEPELQGAVLEIAGGVAVFAGPGSPSNKMIGIGFDGVPGDADLDRIERLFAEHQAPLQAEVSTLADPGVHACLVRRGYEPRGFENLLGHTLTNLDDRRPEGARFERLRPEDFAALEDSAVAAWSMPDVGGVGGDAIPPEAELRRWMSRSYKLPGLQPFAAFVDGTLAAGAALRFDAGIAQFCGAWTVPAFRRRGLQTASVRSRLADAKAAGCDVAVVTVQPASKSQQNVQREGFALLYSRQLLVKMP